MSDPRPAVGPFTDTLYRRLPELYRDADDAQDEGRSNYPLLRYLSLVGDQLTQVAELLGRFTYDPLDDRDNTDPPWQRFGSGLFGDDTYGDNDVADLVDPALADTAWLPWLAQLVGVDVTGMTIPEARAAIADPSSTWAHGTREAIIRRARPRLGDEAYLDVVPHHQGDPFTMALVTKSDETYGSTTWAELAESAPTWADLEALGSWHNLEAASIIGDVQAERPAGFRIAHVYLEDLDTTPPPPPVPVNLLGERGLFEDEALALEEWRPNPVWGTFPVDASRAVITGDGTEGDKCLEITWNASDGCIITLLEGLVPGLSYRVTADVKIPTGSGDVALMLLFKSADTFVRTRDVWTAVESPVYVADSTHLWLGIRTPYGAATATKAGDKVRVDNVRVTIV